VAEDIIVLTEGGLFYGHDGVREQARALAQYAGAGPGAVGSA
jgi:hypothetical protein